MHQVQVEDPIRRFGNGRRAISLEACDDDFDLPPGPTRYCPTELLGTFTLLMAGHGRCVSSAMMLGDREYAMWQLARAQTLGNEELREVALRLFAYFDETRIRAFQV
jgi:hypothetical protein